MASNLEAMSEIGYVRAYDECFGCASDCTIEAMQIRS